MPTLEMVRRPAFSVEELKRKLSYNKKTGLFTWKDYKEDRPHWVNHQAGKLAGSGKIRKKITINGVSYRTARLAWFYVYDEWPEGDIDHKNRNSLDDRISNLRPASHSQNLMNRGPQRNNKSGFKGVWLVKKGIWASQITTGGRRISLGRHDSPEVASVAYQQASLLYHGDFRCQH